jgi:hypothetical protein
MNIDRSLVGAVGSAAVVGVAAYPPMGFGGSLLLGAAAFFVVAFIGSGYHASRAVAWGVVVAALCVVGRFGPDPLAPLFYALGGLLFLAGVLSPAFRRWWFAQAIG